jgi:NAD(P)H-nitrite reductase large subunit
MIGRGKAYDGAVLMNSLSIGGIPLISYGVTNPPEGEGYQVITREQGRAGVYKKIVLKEHRIRGIILLGRIDNAGVLLSLIQRREDVSSFEDRLVSDQFGYGTLVGSVGAPDLARYHNP